MGDRERLPNRRESEASTFDLAGITYRAQWSRFPDGRLAELFLDAGKIGTAVQITATDGAILVSLLLQHGVQAEAILHSLSKLQDGTPAGPIGRAFMVASARG